MKEMNIEQVAKATKGRIIYNDLAKDLSTTTISSVSTNSKDLEQGALFVPIVGERVDAHDFIEDAKRNGAKVCLTSRDDIYHKDIICIKVDDTLKALQDLATYYRSQFPIPVIGITGSVGKTTTKEMVSSALSTKYRVLKTLGNMNSQVGLPLMMFKIEEDHELAVIEMGISEEGEMDRLVKIAKPDVAIVTNIGISHIALLKTQENIRKEKLKIINEFSKGSRLFINGNDPLLRDLVDYKALVMDKDSSCNNDEIDLDETTRDKIISNPIISFGTNERNTYSAKNVRVDSGKTYFTLVNSISACEEEIVLNVLGEHNINNALCAIAVAEFYNIDAAVAKKGLEDYRPISMRGEIKEVASITIIDDTYNASPDSMKSGINVLLSTNNSNRKIAVLADVLELGSLSEGAHYQVGEYIASKHIDEVITIGKEARHIASGVNANNKDIITHSFDNNEQAIGYLDNTLRPGDALLVKGSRGMKTEEIVNYFICKYKED
ncbi:MAG: UDP-N-acetylmuramoyl-tripeptide--D-alanyl-D-alanine ligase [Clostridiales bacterium]|nr:UDP-N-acetylmuramoyl-tripeptide--D-alanyl-D-alanine ligase [Clostridiales bacterium]